MLKDILFLTKKVFNEALVKEENLQNPKKVYDVYRKLRKVISNVNLVANHYLALDFCEPYLQDSSWGKPIDKWRKFFNKDLEELNNSAKQYLQNLSHLTHEDFGFETYVNTIYNAKTYYSFVRDNYNVGFVEPRGSFLHMDILKTKLDDIETFYISEYKKIDLSSFEARKILQEELNQINEILKIESLKLKDYILKRYTMEDLF